jgi:acetoacetyl-CoA reductase
MTTHTQTKRLALVTGGTRGIGSAIAITLHEAGYKVVATYNTNHEGAKKFSESSGIAIAQWDVQDIKACEEGIARIEDTFKAPVEILVNNAGITRDSFFHKMSASQWLEVISTNLSSLFSMTRPLISGMRSRQWGRIINISSINGQKGQVGQTNYCAAKAGVIGFTKALAQENAAKGITVNCICPGYIATDMVNAMSENILKHIVEQIPLGRLGKPEEIASLVRYLVSEDAAFMTGSVLAINGGQYMIG